MIKGPYFRKVSPLRRTNGGWLSLGIVKHQRPIDKMKLWSQRPYLAQPVPVTRFLSPVREHIPRNFPKVTMVENRARGDLAQLEPAVPQQNPGSILAFRPEGVPAKICLIFLSGVHQRFNSIRRSAIVVVQMCDELTFAHGQCCIHCVRAGHSPSVDTGLWVGPSRRQVSKHYSIVPQTRDTRAGVVGAMVADNVDLDVLIALANQRSQATFYQEVRPIHSSDANRNQRSIFAEGLFVIGLRACLMIKLYLTYQAIRAEQREVDPMTLRVDN